MIQKIVAENGKQRFHLQFEPSTGADNGEGIWWIRANQGHTLKAYFSVPIIQVQCSHKDPLGGCPRAARDKIARRTACCNSRYI